MKDVLYLFLFMFYANINAQITQVTEIKSNNVFIQTIDSTYIEDGNKVCYSIPLISSLGTFAEKKMYNLGVTIAWALDSKYVVGCFKVDYLKEIDTTNLSEDDSSLNLNISYFNISDYGDFSILDVYVSQKLKRSWLKKEKKLYYGAIQIDRTELVPFQANNKSWTTENIVFPKEFDFSKPIYVYVVVRNPKDRVVIYFP